MTRPTDRRHPAVEVLLTIGTGLACFGLVGALLAAMFAPTLGWLP